MIFPRMSRNMYIMLAVVVLVIVVAAVHFSSPKELKEKFDAFTSEFTKNLGMYPDVFKPMVIESSKIDIPEQKMTVPIAIGDGLAVQAEISVPAQSATAPTQESAVPPSSFEKSAVKVEDKTITLPGQTGVIPVVVDGKTGAMIGVPVTVPEQTVQIKAQDAHVQVMEGFRA